MQVSDRDHIFFWPATIALVAIFSLGIATTLDAVANFFVSEILRTYATWWWPLLNGVSQILNLTADTKIGLLRILGQHVRLIMACWLAIFLWQRKISDWEIGHFISAIALIYLVHLADLALAGAGDFSVTIATLVALGPSVILFDKKPLQSTGRPVHNRAFWLGNLLYLALAVAVVAVSIGISLSSLQEHNENMRLVFADSSLGLTILILSSWLSWRALLNFPTNVKGQEVILAIALFLIGFTTSAAFIWADWGHV